LRARRRMSIRMQQKWLIVVAAFLIYSPISFALGLGEITIRSKLNQPLDAEIEITSATQQEIDNLSVSVPSDDIFQRYDLERVPVLSNLQFAVEERNNNRRVIQIRSNKVVQEPFLTFLVQAIWPQGRLLREYTVLVDPPLYVPGESGAATTTTYIDPAATQTYGDNNN